ncbi:uracil-DNA glycosylase [Mycoplasma phocoenae]|uniref:Uracil-DNA glycosylase n=2 Tax=Mycoplasma phocoenae TaxID=754517 RepID=A0A858U487_9MOLU|nr:uracil-DNA glycosylase [Mycoplasma phocoenae]
MMKFNFNEFLNNEKEKEYFKKLINLLNNENRKIVPSKDKWFNAFDMDFNELKVVIIGQDPYFLPNVADGMAFSTESIKTPVSLRNIFKEIKNSYPNVSLKTNNLNYWKQQGILLINTTLTTVENLALAHKDWGWETFVSNALESINQHNENIVYILLGKKAMDFVKNMDLQKQHILSTSHPSGLSAYRGFIGSNIFKKTNDYLLSINKKEIDWSTK